ncbi:MAG TPA: non-homologous end-joining DNA ligase [Tepidisphaeraceae bacterium]|nr:non-homologous end-joining DNA ligase [Tepidisphaeraceae bacterium]
MPRAKAKKTPPAAPATALPASIEIDGKQIALSNLGKVLYPEAGFTKGQVIDYYLRIAPAMLPHLSNRPLTLKRYPNGVDEKFFYEKRCPKHRPDWVKTGQVWSRDNNAFLDYCLVDSRATMVWLGNLACLEMHTLLSRLPKVEVPTSMVFDLDPGPPADILDSIRVGIQMRDLLQKLGLQSFAKTSGSKGLHLWVPLNTATTFDRTKEFSHAMALLLERENPKEVTSVMRKELRHGKVLVDWSQNDNHKTTASAYTLRARAEPTVSTPVTWDELEAAFKKREPARIQFTTNQVLKRVEKHGDLFAPVLTLKQRLPKE